ncbi:MAG: undecaprenyl-diphosphate phosphatase [Thermodesulfovibrionales bacterium]|nr:undecaprenyl-diphosphate phosphatase [Thermodesulfovibrionales bacterium]
MSTLQAIILGIVEGLTEFLPISSTGHMIIVSYIMGISDDNFVKTFEIAIQLGAILSVVLLYYKRFIRLSDIYFKLAVSFFPTGVVGLIAYKTIKIYLFNPFVVASALIVGGIILILIDKWSMSRSSRFKDIADISYRSAFIVGCMQCISMIPGVSRAGATIIGGIIAGFDRRQATEFSFLLAVPTMFAATGYDLYKNIDKFSDQHISLLLIGGFVSFISAIIAIKALIYIVPKHGFKHFGIYRIIFGILFLVFSAYL